VGDGTGGIHGSAWIRDHRLHPVHMLLEILVQSGRHSGGRNNEVRPFRGPKRHVPQFSVRMKPGNRRSGEKPFLAQHIVRTFVAVSLSPPSCRPGRAFVQSILSCDSVIDDSLKLTTILIHRRADRVPTNMDLRCRSPSVESIGN
jgi:hypothetical protein